MGKAAPQIDNLDPQLPATLLAQLPAAARREVAWRVFLDDAVLRHTIEEDARRRVQESDSNIVSHLRRELRHVQHQLTAVQEQNERYRHTIAQLEEQLLAVRVRSTGGRTRGRHDHRPTH